MAVNAAGATSGSDSRRGRELWGGWGMVRLSRDPEHLNRHGWMDGWMDGGREGGWMDG